MEEEFKFISDRFEIEALFEKNDATQGLVVTHPHPLYGGDMYNPVVEAVINVCRRKGYTTLRFNFRGVGASQGYYDNGEGEREDVRAACSCLSDMGIQKILLAGYSFGAWVNAHVSPDRAPYDQMIMVSPPVAFVDFSAVKTIPSLKLVTSGSRDDIAPPALIQQALAGWCKTARHEIINGANHFYTATLSSLEAVLQAAV